MTGFFYVNGGSNKQVFNTEACRWGFRALVINKASNSPFPAERTVTYGPLVVPHLSWSSAIKPQACQQKKVGVVGMGHVGKVFEVKDEII